MSKDGFKGFIPNVAIELTALLLLIRNFQKFVTRSGAVYPHKNYAGFLSSSRG
jgi:hypothetical protein